VPERFSSHPIILFDGVCNLCNGFVQFILKRDTKDVFRFGSLQSEQAQLLLKQYAPKTIDLSTVVLLDGGTAATESDAVLLIAKKLGGVWSILYVFIILPKFVRDALYRFVARHRYKIFGQRDSCMIPTPEIQKKFI
jgi:predicted DCC family thiol-disulfide oxidoreductase YuxK